MNAAAVSGGDPDLGFDGIGNGSRRSAVQHPAVNKTLMLFGSRLPVWLGFLRVVRPHQQQPLPCC